jgi:hypothetical protein
MIFRQKPQCRLQNVLQNEHKIFSLKHHGAIKHIMTKTVANDDNILIKFSDDNDTHTLTLHEDPVSPCDALLTSLKYFCK